MGGNGKINAERRETIGKIADTIAGHAVDRGRLIEMGFALMVEQTMPDWQNVPRERLQELRMAFFGGAQHLFGSIMGMLDEGEVPTERDTRRMFMIEHELEAFIEEYKQKNGITDPDIGAGPQTKQ